MPTTPSNERLTLDLALKTMREGLVILDVEGNVICANPAAQEIVGFKKEVFEGLNIYQMPRTLVLLHPDESLMTGAELAGARALFERQPISDVMVGIQRTGQELRWVLSNARPLIADGELIGAITTFVDVTTLQESVKQKEKAIKQAKEAEQRSKALFDGIAEALHQYYEGNYANQYVGIAKKRLAPLTTRELDVLTLLAQGKSNLQIADTLQLAEATVRGNISDIYTKLNVDNRVQACIIAWGARLANFVDFL